MGSWIGGKEFREIHPDPQTSLCHNDSFMTKFYRTNIGPVTMRNNDCVMPDSALLSV